MLRSFLLGAMTGAAVVWLWGDRIRDLLAEQTRTVRTRAADGLQAVEETTDDLLDRAARPLHRVEQLLDETKSKIGENLRAGQEAIRPTPRETSDS